MQQGPQRAVGEAVVVVVQVGAVEVEGEIVDMPFALLLQTAAVAAHGLPAPAEPDPAAFAQRVGKSNG